MRQNALKWANRANKQVDAHKRTLFFYLLPQNPLLFLVFPFTQAYIPLYGITVAYDYSQALSNSATILPSSIIVTMRKSSFRAKASTHLESSYNNLQNKFTKR